MSDDVDHNNCDPWEIMPGMNVVCEGPPGHGSDHYATIGGKVWFQW